MMLPLSSLLELNAKKIQILFSVTEMEKTGFRMKGTTSKEVLTVD